MLTELESNVSREINEGTGADSMLRSWLKKYKVGCSSFISETGTQQVSYLTIDR